MSRLRMLNLGHLGSPAFAKGADIHGDTRVKTVQSVQFRTGTKEELLPDFSAEFPYVATRAELNQYIDGTAPWHWHAAVELFYIESGTLEYFTPRKRFVFPAGTGGFLNANVLHMGRALKTTPPLVSLIHLFDPSLIAGEMGSRIEQRYVLPILRDPDIEVVALSPKTPEHQGLLTKIRDAFRLSEQMVGYELRVREAMSAIWLDLFQLLAPSHSAQASARQPDQAIKQMLTYIYAHYPEKISIDQLAASAYLSKRACFRLFREALNTSPLDAITDYRLQMACRKLLKTNDSISTIGYDCGLGSSSYFGKIFRKAIGCTPLAYRTNGGAPAPSATGDDDALH